MRWDEHLYGHLEAFKRGVRSVLSLECGFRSSFAAHRECKGSFGAQPWRLRSSCTDSALLPVGSKRPYLAQRVANTSFSCRL